MPPRYQRQAADWARGLRNEKSARFYCVAYKFTPIENSLLSTKTIYAMLMMRAPKEAHQG
jgi:hypothetical protein